MCSFVNISFVNISFVSISFVNISASVKNATFSHHQRSNVPTSASEDFRPWGHFSGAFKRSELSKPMSPLFWASEGLVTESMYA